MFSSLLDEISDHDLPRAHPNSRPCWGILPGRANLAFEEAKIVTDGHGKGQELFQCLLRLIKGDGNPAWKQADSRRQVVKLLGEDPHGGFDEKLRPFQAIVVELGEDFGNFAPAPAFVVGIVAIGEATEVGDESIPCGQSVGPYPVGDARGHDLLSPAAADAEQELDGGPIDERTRQELQLANDQVNFAVPGWFCGHGILTMLVRTRAKCNQRECMISNIIDDWIWRPRKMKDLGEKGLFLWPGRKGQG